MADGMSEAVGRGVVLLGCGKMGLALAEGWVAGGAPASSLHILEPNPSDRVEALRAQGASVNAPPPDTPSAVLLAVKPQMMAEALPPIAPLAGTGAAFISIAAGTPISFFEDALGATTPVIRAMPNTPAAVGRGVTALIANAAGAPFLDRAEALMAAVGETVRLDDEAQMDAVTGLSGSGPAYVFHMIEALAAAGEAEGLSPALAMRLARATVSGAGELARRSDETAEALRVAVTSPGGTTQAGLEVLMDERSGLGSLIRRTVSAAAERSRALRGQAPAQG